MNLETVLYDVREGVATITLNRPEAMNAWTPQLSDDLSLAMGAADADDAVRAVVLTGAGRAFCAGADLSSGKDTFNPSFDNFAVKEDDFRRDSGGILTLRMYKFLKPIILYGLLCTWKAKNQYLEK